MWKSKYITALSLLIPFSCVSAMEKDNSTPPSFAHNLAIGSAAGVTEVVVSGQPLTFVKNTLQQMQKPAELSPMDQVRFTVKHFAKQPPSQFYRGVGVNMVSMVPTTALQIGLSEELKNALPGNDLSTSFLRNGTSGAVAAFICNPSELIIVNQQNWKANPRETIRRLYKAKGAKVWLRGYTAKALRDGNFCAGFLTAYPEVKNYFQEQTGNATVATALSTLAVGPVTAAASHPFDTISTRMQADPSQKNITGFSSATKAIYEEGGVKAFFSGFTPRTTRILIAIPLMTAVKEWLSNER